MTGRLRLRSDLEWREIEGEVVAVDEQSSEYLGVNRTGAGLWSLLAEGTTRAELLERLTGTFDVDDATASRDLGAFLAMLERRGLLEVE
jgi:hypothetical protein